MYPIIGKRCKCKDCKEVIGFDLSESCYNTSSKLPSIFNQKHKQDHRFELTDSHMFYNIQLQKSLSMEDPYQGLYEDNLYVDETVQNENIDSNNTLKMEKRRYNEDRYMIRKLIREEKRSPLYIYGMHK
ncbi:E3 ubiquitin-protein ligase PRT1 [Dendrobium catenatum]|uniref:E3 ubiquitin-protein ligase PRT1 n=1 Tax=Dendrobium catenatum TaxID=906689 RepID=A0A2I0X583_9ASPA|nr:E3 ubiquitin-protein ligase PRT1 [Dendrobium catenatum]